MEWEKLVEREGDFLKNYLLYENYVENFPRVFNRHHSHFLTTREGDKFIHYTHRTDSKKFSKFLKEENKKNPDFLREVVETGKKHFETLINFASDVNHQNLKSLTHQELEELVKTYFKLYKEPYPYFNITIFPQEFESDKEAICSMAELRLTGRNSFNKTHELIEPLFTEIARRKNVTAAELKSLKPIEILGLFHGDKINVKEISRKRQNCYFMFQNGKFDLNEDTTFPVKEELKSDLNGQGTFNSRYRGKIKLIHSHDDLQKMDKGDIMVLRTVTPELITKGAEIAGAIITDEGGLTSHAAILSRELQIPALIGTKKASELLNDGDIVEIDGEKGTAVISSRTPT